MKVSDYIVEYLIKKEITDVFGYPGGMVTHLMDSFSKYQDKIAAHTTYHEQGAAFAACGYAQVSGKPGVAYATSGPGATNLITGICDAFFDSIPTVFITGQVNTFEEKGSLGVRQRGFQETDIVSIVRPVTKYVVSVDDASEIPLILDKAFEEALSGRMGPVLLDIPMNIFRAEIDVPSLQEHEDAPKEDATCVTADIVTLVQEAFEKANRPCLLIGNGVKLSHRQNEIKEEIHRLGIPAVTSMIAFDVLADDAYNYGFIGAYGERAANFIVAKSDLILSVGSRLDIRQVGAKRENFAPQAKLIRFDVDPGELEYAVHSDETDICLSMDGVLSLLKQVNPKKECTEWIGVCNQIRALLAHKDDRNTGNLIQNLGSAIPENVVITTDVGQNQVWIAQSLELKKGQNVLFSGGHGAMGYSLPAAIGACHACGKKPVVAITGDGGLQMNIQELQYVARENLPVKIVVLNNNALGMIRHFQEMYFNGDYFQTKAEGGYTAPCFADVAKAYKIPAIQVEAQAIIDDPAFVEQLFQKDGPSLLEVMIREDTYVFPKLEFGKPNQDQEPLLERDLYANIMTL